MMNNKKKFSIVDLAIIFAFICIIGGIVFRTYTKNNHFTNANNVRIEYTLEIRSTDTNIRKSLNVSDKLFLADQNLSCGTISHCDRTAAKVYEKGENGNMLLVTDTSAIDITLTVQADASKTQSGYCVNHDTYIVPGNSLIFTNTKCQFVAQIKSIKEISTDNIG